MAKRRSLERACRQNNGTTGLELSIHSTTSTGASSRSSMTTPGSGSPNSAGGSGCPRPRWPSGFAGYRTAGALSVPGRGRATRARLHHLRHRPGQPDHARPQADPRRRPPAASGHRVLPHHRRRLLLHEGAPALNRRARADPGPLHAAGPHDHLDRQRNTRPTPAAPRHRDRAEAGRRRSRLSRSPPARTQTTVLNAP